LPMPSCTTEITPEAAVKELGAGASERYTTVRQRDDGKYTPELAYRDEAKADPAAPVGNESWPPVVGSSEQPSRCSPARSRRAGPPASELRPQADVRGA
jgi:hypothetical protein